MLINLVELTVVLAILVFILLTSSVFLNDSQKEWLKGVTRYEKVVAYLGKVFGRKGGRK
jgi:hypothetical protein